MRIFFGIFPPPAIVASLAAMRERAREVIGDRAKWVRDDKLHLTLQFLGEHTKERTARALELARTVRAAPFELAIGAFGTFPHVLWIGVDGPVGPLAKALGEVLAADGFAIDAREYHPHVTIARYRGRTLPELPAVEPAGAFVVDRFALIESRGGGYHTLEELTLD